MARHHDRPRRVAWGMRSAVARAGHLRPLLQATCATSGKTHSATTSSRCKRRAGERQARTRRARTLVARRPRCTSASAIHGEADALRGVCRSTLAPRSTEHAHTRPHRALASPRSTWMGARWHPRCCATTTRMTLPRRCSVEELPHRPAFQHAVYSHEPEPGPEPPPAPAPAPPPIPLPIPIPQPLKGGYTTR